MRCYVYYNVALSIGFNRFLDPLVYGDYPHSMRSIVGRRLPKFTKEQSMMVKGSYDYIGINYYTAYYASYTPNSNNPKSYTTDSLATLSCKIFYFGLPTNIDKYFMTCSVTVRPHLFTLQLTSMESQLVLRYVEFISLTKHIVMPMCR